MSEFESGLREKLGGKPLLSVVAMPDFFLDYVLSFPGNLDEMTKAMIEVAARGGGNILGWKHMVGRGGNSANFSAQLSRLGAKVTPVIETDMFGKLALSQFLKEVDLSHVASTGLLSRTLAFEAEHSGRRVNIMASDPGSLANFGHEKLSESDRKLIVEADFVCVFNWNQNLKGTELAEEVFHTVKENGRGVTFFDPGDPSPKKFELSRLNDKVLSKGLVDILSVNENELSQLGQAVGAETSGLEGEEENPLFHSGSVLSMFGGRVDLHTPEYSATFVDGQRERVLCASTIPMKVTGAGDAWNAGDVFAQAMGLVHKERLVFANATAAAYMNRPDLEPSSLAEVLDHIGPIVKLNNL